MIMNVWNEMSYRAYEKPDMVEDELSVPAPVDFWVSCNCGYVYEHIERDIDM